MLKVTASVFCVSGPLVFDTATKGCPLMARLWCWGGLYFWVLQECGNWRDSSWQATTTAAQGTTQTVDWGTYSSLSVKESSLLVLELQPEGQVPGLVHFRGLWSCSQGT